MRRTPQLTPRQREMLRLTVQYGAAYLFVRTAVRSAWRIRVGAPGQASPVRTFSQPTGNKLVDLGYLERDTDRDVIGSDGIIARCYVVSAAGIARLRLRNERLRKRDGQ